MAFTKKTWVNVPDPSNPPSIPEGQDALARFDADNMNRIEEGIENVNASLASHHADTSLHNKSDDGGAFGREASSISGGAVGYQSSSTSGGAVGYKATAESGGAAGYKATTTNGGAIGDNASSLYGGGAVGYQSSSISGGAVGKESSSSNGGAVGYQAKSESGGAIGNGASATYGAAIGDSAAETNGGGAVGYKARSTSGGGAVGYNASAVLGSGAIGQESSSSEGGGAAGYKATTTNGGGAIGSSAKTISGGAIGNSAESESGGAIGSGTSAGDGFSGGRQAKVAKDSSDKYIDAIQLGMGTNENEKTLQVYDYQLMDALGKIPHDRLPDTAAKTQIGSFKGTGNSEDSNGSRYANPITLTFDFKPKVVFIIGTDYYCYSQPYCLVQGVTEAQFDYDDTYISAHIRIQWEGNSVTWTLVGDYKGLHNNTAYTYHYVAIG